MEQLSFNSIFLQLSSTPPVVGSTLSSFNTLVTLQGITTVHLDYNFLYFNVKSFKTVVNWDETDTQTINLNLNPLYTITSNNSAVSKHTFTPSSVISTVTSNAFIYYENGVIHKFNMVFNLVPDNIIDQSLFIVDTQLTNDSSSIFNIESQKHSVLYSQKD